jgi:uncharacterized membrane protein YfcA
MTEFELAALCVLIFAAATLYTSVGHAGASGYIAAMAIVGLPSDVMKPTALTLNILVAGLATARWTDYGRSLAWKALLPLIAGSIPAAFFGGAYQLSAEHYRLLVGLILLAAALRFIWQPKSETDAGAIVTRVPWLAGLLTGAVVGLLSGLTGTGGGIFLTPMLLLFGWAGARQASGLTAPFILLNSIAALTGNYTAIRQLPEELPLFVAAAIAGAVLGTQIGTRWISTQTLQRLLGVVLLIAAGKFLLT